MIQLANVKIARKLALLIGASVLQVACLTGVAWWGVHSLDTQMDHAKDEARRTALALRASSQVNALGVNVANALLARKFDAATMDRIAAFRKGYVADLDELATLSNSAEGKRRRETMAQTLTEWREADLKVIAASEADNPEEALKLYREQVIPRFQELGAALIDYQAYRQRQVDQINQTQHASVFRTRVLLLAFGGVWLAISCALGVVIAGSISKPLEAAVKHLEEVAAGDMLNDMSAEYLEREDEIGLLSQSMRTMSGSLRNMIGKVNEGIGVLSSSSGQLSANSSKMSDGSREASGKAHAVAAAAEQMTANVVSVAAGMEQTTTNLTSVASATEQMTATIGEIAGNSEKARRITEEATRQAATHQRTDEPVGRGGPADRQSHRNHHRDFIADQFAGAQRDHRGGPRRFGGQGIRGSGQRDQGTGQADRRAPPKISRVGSRACNRPPPAGSPKSTKCPRSFTKSAILYLPSPRPSRNSPR